MKTFSKIDPKVKKLKKCNLYIALWIAKKCANKKHSFTVTLKELAQRWDFTREHWSHPLFGLMVRTLLDEMGFSVEVVNKNSGVVLITQKKLEEYAIIWNDFIWEYNWSDERYNPLDGLLNAQEIDEIKMIPDVDKDIQSWLKKLSLYDMSASKSEIGVKIQLNRENLLKNN